MKKNSLTFTLLLTAAIVLGGGAKVSAQESLFGRENNGPRSSNHQESLLRDNINPNGNFTLGGVTNSENPETAPLGSGIAMLVAAGAGYALLKRKEEQQ